MPTGYTAKLMESGQSFPDFAMTCARAFGALLPMRDDRADAPIPEKFEPSNYNAKALAKARRRLTRLRTMTAAQKRQYGERQRTKIIAGLRRCLARELNQNNRINAVLAVAVKWEPPTSEHKGLKDFMIEQLTISRHDIGWVERNLEANTARKPMAFYAADLATAIRDIEYHTSGHADEVKRAADRTKWVADLRASLK